MARILLVSSAARTAPRMLSAMTLLPYDIVSVHGPEAALAHKGAQDLFIIDGRADLVKARTVCQKIAAAGRAPILLLVPIDSLAVLNASWGFDDFVAETTTAAELDARVRRLLESVDGAAPIQVGPLVIDEASYKVFANGRPVDLTYTEFELLKYMVGKQGRVLSREQLLADVWGYDYFGGTRTVDVHIRRLRAKLGPRLEHNIQTVRNVGYRFSPDR